MSKTEFKKWECIECQNDKFVFNHISIKDIVSMSFNSNFQCPCLDSSLNSFLSRRKLYTLDLFKKSDNDKFYIQPDPIEEIDRGLKIDTHFDYYEEHDFHKLVKSPQLSNKGIFSIFHTNIESIHNKLDNLHISLANLGHTFDVIALSETWTVDKRASIGELDGYNKFVFTTGSSLKGGCGFFL